MRTLPPLRRWAALGAVVLLTACSEAADSGQATHTDSDRDLASAAPYVVLGDSISAGAGAPPYDSTSGGCGRSPQGWPALVDEVLADVSLSANDACGGAAVVHLVGPWVEQGLPPQVPGEQHEEVALVTLTVGANDVGYGAFLFSCLFGDCSGVAPTDAAVYEDKLSALRSALLNDLYPSLRIAFPNARIVHVGYPRLVTTESTGVCPWLSAAEQALVVEVLDDVNRTIEGAVAEADDDRLEFVDVADALDQHELCAVDSWVIPLGSADGGHPDVRGYAAIARRVVRALS